MINFSPVNQIINTILQRGMESVSVCIVIVQGGIVGE